MYFFLLNPCFQHYPRISANTIILIFPGKYQSEIYPVARNNSPPLLKICRRKSSSPSVHTHILTDQMHFLLKTAATSQFIYLEQAWKAWRGEWSVSGKNAVCWWHSVTSASLKSAHRMQLLLSHLTGPEHKLAKSGFTTDSFQNEPFQFPHKSQRIQGKVRDCHFPQTGCAAFPSSANTWKWFTTSKSS